MEDWHEWGGMYLRHCPKGNKAYVANKKRNAAKVQSVVRVVEAHRWDKKAIENIRGTPGDMQPAPDDSPTADDVERTESPHDYERREVDPEVRSERRPQQKANDDRELGGRSRHHGPRRVRNANRC